MFQKSISAGRLFNKAGSDIRRLMEKGPGVAQTIARGIESGANQVSQMAGALEKVPGVSPLATTVQKISGGVKTIAHGVANVRGSPEQVVQRLTPTVRRGMNQIGTAF